MRHRTSETFDPEAKGGKNRITKAGKYHFLVHAPEGGIESENEAKFECEALAAPDGMPEQVGKTAGLRIEFEATSRDGGEVDPKIQDTVDRKIAVATTALQLVEHLSGGIASVETWKAWKGKDVEFNFEEADGRQFVAEVRMREFDEKDKETGQPTGKKLQTPDIMWWTMLPANDERAVKFPRNAEYLSLLGGSTGGGNGSKPAPAPAATTSTTETTPADPWASLV